jgi:hypothetical protein
VTWQTINILTNFETKFYLETMAHYVSSDASREASVHGGVSELLLRLRELPRTKPRGRLRPKHDHSSHGNRCRICRDVLLPFPYFGLRLSFRVDIVFKNASRVVQTRQLLGGCSIVEDAPKTHGAFFLELPHS